jgi:ATP-dependent DNA helicase DinG
MSNRLNTINTLATVSLEFLKSKIAKAMSNFEFRPSQVEMIKACSNIIELGGTLLAEAGTGTGKTFAYLIPLILSGKKGIISTRTINLQEQLSSKDLKFLTNLVNFNYAIIKGRSNYLCLRRFNSFKPETEKETEIYKNLFNWASTTDSGDLDNLIFNAFPIWNKICSDSDACRKTKCGFYNDCFYFKARRTSEKAQIVIVNHALLSVNGMLPKDKKILPEADVLVIDEAHALDTVLSEHIGLNISNRGIENILNTLLRLDGGETYRGLLSKFPASFPVIESLRSELSLFWSQVKNIFQNRESIKGTFKLKNSLYDLSNSIKLFLEKTRNEQLGFFEENEELELNAFLKKLHSTASAMETFSEGTENTVRWVEIEENRVALRMTPIYPQEFVNKAILPKYQSIILTSATLSVCNDFSFITKILGLENSQKISVPSPYDFKEQVTIEIKKGIGLINQDQDSNILSQVILKEAAQKDGGILVLFTSKSVMRKTWELCLDELLALGLNPMMQGKIPNKAILQTMRESQNSVIFGLDSFWEGVDVKGDSLKCLIITKLPFEVPTEPLVMARTEEIRKQGGDPFNEYTLPRAVLKFKQGFGRLIRSTNDRGRVIICDERIETKYYGRKFLKAVNI